MGFLTGKTAIITGAEDVVLSDMELLQLMLRRVLILSLQDVMKASLPPLKKN